MGLSLIAFTLNWEFVLVCLKVAFGLGFVIFVHELGHFAVAKWCGVKCEKFYLGFDIYGLKLFKYVYGETEYGIGILPLGGYVKMLGQDDNPARAAEERERSLVHAADGSETEATKLDPRSYMAKSVPQRMAIISAGVIMNVIFAVLMAALAYGIGVNDIACGISRLNPGDAAWRANLQPGDMILRIGGLGDRQVRYRDLMGAVALCDMEKGVEFLIQREGVKEPFWVTIKPDHYTRQLRPTIGVYPPVTNALSEAKAAFPGTPAAEVNAFKPGDKIVAVDGQTVATFHDWEAALTKQPDQPAKFTVERKSDKQVAGEEPSAERLDIEVPARPMLSFGFVMKLGKITAVQEESPAAAADLRAGDFIVEIDGQPPGDPLRVNDMLRAKAGETITLSISRAGPTGQDETLSKQVTVRSVPWPEESRDQGSPVSLSSLGVTCKVLNILHDTDKDSPAAQAQLTKDGKPAAAERFASGDEIVKVDFDIPKQEDKDLAFDEKPKPLVLNAEAPNWPYLMWLVQQLPADTKYTFTLNDGRSATLTPARSADWYYVNRGLIPAVETITVRADSVGQAFRLGLRETIDGVGQVYSFLGRIGSQVSPFALGGPKAIAEAAGMAAQRGYAELLIFLTMLSANLAVLNFLPIPLLDGGHMVFLALEGILRRPVSEKVVVGFHYLGFVFIISLMLFVLGLDFGIIPRPH